MKKQIISICFFSIKSVRYARKDTRPGIFLQNTFLYCKNPEMYIRLIKTYSYEVDLRFFNNPTPQLLFSFSPPDVIFMQLFAALTYKKQKPGTYRGK